MSLNLASLQQKADQVIHNADEAIRKWQEFITAPAGTVQMQYYDQNGNLKTVSFPNRNKVVNDFISNVNSAMKKTIYLDPVNGNDSNDGSQNAPFKTLKKAVDSVPVGGYGYIYLRDGNYIIDADIYLFNKVITFNCYESSSNTSHVSIGFSTYSIYSLERPYKFILQNSVISFLGYNNLAITTPTQSLDLPLFDEPVFMTQFGQGIVNFYDCTIYVNDYKLVGGYFSLGIQNIVGAIFDSCTIYKNTSQFVVSADKLLIHSSHNDSLQDGNGNSITWSSAIRGIVKDANGVPRNIISNAIL